LNAILKYTIAAAASVSLFALVLNSDARVATGNRGLVGGTDSPGVGDTMPYPFEDQSGLDPYYFDNNGPLKLEDPANIKKTVTYDPDSNVYVLTQTVGGQQYRPPMYMTLEEYVYYDMQKSVDDYWKQRVQAESQAQGHGSKGLIPPIKINSEKFDRIFGGGTIDIRPQGSAELIFGVNVNRTDNPALPERQRRIATFEFDEKIQLNVVGKIGEKLKLTTNYNTESTFEFENQMKLEYNGFEDEIIKKIEAGNVTFGLNSSLITGSQTLFGIKTELQFGRLTMTNIISQQRGKKSEVNVTGGAQVTNFEVTGENYEANKHFFLSQYFYNSYDAAMANLPVINSGVMITRVEVWVTNRTGVVDNTRNIVCFADLGEDSLELVGSSFIDISGGNGYPDNDNNDLYSQLLTTYSNLRNPQIPLSTTFQSLASTGFAQAVNYEKINNARKLLPTEYTLNDRLGFISLNQALNYDEIVAVSFQYTLNGEVYQVGEFSTDGIGGQDALIVKMLKSTNNVPKVSSTQPYRTWDLMMKNIYSIGAYQVNPQDFQLQVWYNNPSTGTDIPFIPEGPIGSVPLIQVMGLDKLNQQMQPSPDGQFDFIDRITVYANNGRVIFPVTEPFGKHLYGKFAGDPNQQQLYLKYGYPQLYDSTKTVASTTFAGKNRFKLKGSYKSSSNSDISLNAVNIPAGSVTVTAGGAPLQENVDYTVDYTLGRVRIINESVLNSGVPIKISLESNSLFNIQSKTLWGTHLNYRVNRDFNIGGTIMNLTERPITQKINIGDEPMSNTIMGLDVNYRTEAPFLTRMVDRLPLINTKAPSSITFQGEFAYLRPGHNKAIGKNGNSYIDDFEGTQSAIDIRSPQSWSIASVPQGQPTRWAEASEDSITSGLNRAKFCWYVIDPLFLRPDNNLKPDHITLADQSNHFVREVLETEVFPNKQPPSGQPMNISMLDIAFYPDERGPYNFDVLPTPVSAGLDPSGNGLLADPASRWGGIQRRIETNDFESANIEFIQFWMMDPYHEDNAPAAQNSTGEIFIHLGNISEDVLKDSRNSFENGIPANGDTSLLDNTPWGQVPVVQSIVNAFDNDETARPIQDVGLDGLGDEAEKTYFTYLADVNAAFPGSQAAVNAEKDPSGDNYHYYRGSDYDAQAKPVLERYKMFNGLEGNSPVTGQPNDDGYSEDYPTQATTLPNQEDINRDNTLNESESYYEYRIKLDPTHINASNIGNNYITDVYQTYVTTKDGRSRPITWYQFRVPVRSYDAKVGNIENFNSIRFIRLGIREADKPVVCRFARLEFVRSDWRKYQYSLLFPGEYISNDQSDTEFQVAAINIEENGNRSPINYVLPPGIDREQNVQSATLVRLNEQSLSMKVCDLEDGDSRAAFKTVGNMDVRSYRVIRMFVHAEQRTGSNQPLNDGDVNAFIRIGSDQTENYYEYEMPLEVTPPGSYAANDQVDREKVWPEQNTMELSFELLQYAKQQRNIAIANGTASLTAEYTVADPNHPGRKVTVKGNPNLAQIKVFMLGVRNPKMTSANIGTDDGLSKCAEVWFNELRLTDFDENGGWAATARATAKLADLGTVNVSGNMATPGFGSIEKKVSERLREKQVNYDVSTQLELGRFFPEKTGIRLPLFWGYGETFITPQFNPLDPDILLSPVLSNEELTNDQRDSIRGATVDYTRRKSINFTNVHKEKPKGGKSHIYDISNFTMSYAYTEVYRHNVNIEYSSAKNHRGGLTWSYQPNAKPLKPFEKKKWAKGKWMTIAREFQLGYLPASVGVTMDLNRTYSEVKNRNITGYSDIFTPVNFNKNFLWNRNYDLRWDLTKNIKFDFSADNRAQVLEPYGKIDTPEEKDELISNIRGFGTTMSYHHQSNLSYTVPINKIPAFDWLTGNVRYQTGYTWTRGPLAADTIGNVVGNNAQWQLTGQANMVTLYNKVPYFKKVNNKKVGAKPAQKSNQPKDTTKSKDNDQYVIVEYLARAIMTVRTVSVNYSNNSTVALPGWKPRTQLMGFDQNWDAPGIGFLFGKQGHFGPNKNMDFASYAKTHGWLMQESSIYTPYTRGNTENFTARAALEPFPDLKIELTANKTTTLNRSEFMRWDDLSQTFTRQSTTETGSFSMSIITWNTSFKKEDKDHNSEVFQQLLNNRAVISGRLGTDNPYSTGVGTNGFADGFSKTSQEVLIPAFLAAYTGKNAANASLSMFPAMPLPNWRVTYDGLAKYEKIRKRFKTVTLNHTYRSTYSVGSYLTNLNYKVDGDGFAYVRNVTGDIESKYQVGTVQISEQFSPLLGVEVVWAGKRNLSTKVEYKKDRTLSLSLANTQLTEVSGREFVVGMGYRIPKLKLKFMKKFSGFKLTPPESDLNLRADVSFRNNQTVIRKSVEELNVLTAGQNILSIKTSADYQMTNQLVVRFFCDRVMTNPLVSSSFKTANTNAGLSLRFLLQ
jgi:cell surface protein SprA